MVPPSREFHDLWWKTSFSKFFKNRRKNLIEKIYGGGSHKKRKKQPRVGGGGRWCVVVVPAVNTILEPHTKGIFWQLKDHNKKKKYKHAPLNYFSDDVWPNFEGFAGAKVKRFWHIPFLVCDLIISKVPS